MSADKPPPKAPAGATVVAGEDAAKSDAALPPWRRAAKPEDGPQPEASAQPQRTPVDPLRRPPPNRRDAPWMKRDQDATAAPSGSLTGALSGDAMLSMRPAWMKSSKGLDAEESNNAGIDRSVWSEQRYGRSLMLTAKIKTHKGKAYEVPAEMMSMTTGPRPKYKAEKKEKEEEAPQDGATSGAKKDQATADAAAAVTPEPLPEDQPPAAPSQPDADVENREEVVSKKSSKKKNGNDTASAQKADSVAAVGIYENLPGDSKDIMKLKKKLREIQKIEEGIASKQKQEPNQVEKVTKKAGYLEELKLLESIVHSAGVPNGS